VAFIKGLYFQNLRLKFLELKISQAFGLNSWEKDFIEQLKLEIVYLLNTNLQNRSKK
jgi:hypothetical protein